MSVILTSAQQEVVQRNRRAPGKRPKILRVGAGETEISLDFEAFLILAPVTGKTKAATWISLQTQANALIPRLQRNAVIAEMIADELLDLSARKLAVLGFNASFDDVKSGLQVGAFAAIPEVQNMLDDLQLGNEQFTSFVEQTNYNFQLTTLFAQQIVGLNSDANQYRTMFRSYVVALTSYI
jgi:hypothetical protein